MSKQISNKAEGAMVTIGELAKHIGVPTHVLRYWEKSFPKLQPIQRAGQRRYYRPEDVALVERIHDLLHNQGFTIPGARRKLQSKDSAPLDSAKGRDESDRRDSSLAIDRATILRWRDSLTEAL